MTRKEMLENSDMIQYKLTTDVDGLVKGRKYLAFNTKECYTYGLFIEDGAKILKKVDVADVLLDEAKSDIITYHLGKNERAFKDNWKDLT